MNSKKVLYSNGCSHTAGTEIVSPNSATTDEDRARSFSGQLASRWKLLSINDAQSGQGNYAILSQTLYKISKLLETYDPKEILVLIGWSGFDRVDFVTNDKLYHFNSTTPDSKWPNVVKNAWHLWAKTLDGNVNFNRFSLYYFTLVNFLESYNIDYYMFNAVNPLCRPSENRLHMLDNNNPTLEIFNHMELNERYIFPFNDEYVYHLYLKNAGFDGFVNGRNNHFLESAHIYWANFLNDYMLTHAPATDWITDRCTRN